MKCSEDLFIWYMMQNIGQNYHSKTLFRCFLFSPPFKMHTVRQELPLIRWLIPEHFDCFNIKRATRVLHSTTVLHSGDYIFNLKLGCPYSRIQLLQPSVICLAQHRLYIAQKFLFLKKVFFRKCNLGIISQSYQTPGSSPIQVNILEERISNNFKSGWLGFVSSSSSPFGLPFY